MAPSLFEQLELTENRMVDEEGRLLAKWLPTLRPCAPANVRLGAAGKRLHWEEREPEQTYSAWLFNQLLLDIPPTTDPAGMVDAFVRIKGPDDVLRFARRYGPLRLCGEHGRPSSHRMEYGLLEAPPPDASCKPKGYPDDCSEPVDAWYSYVSQALALLEIGLALGDGRPGPKAAWKTALTAIGRYASPPGVEEDLGTFLSIDRVVLSTLVLTDWLRTGDVHLAYYWEPDADRPSIWLAGGTFGLLAAQLVGVLSRVKAIAICDGCSEPYTRLRRKPQAGKRNFCSACGEKVASKHRKRALRAKRKGET